jgi:hypothetical protein
MIHKIYHTLHSQDAVYSTKKAEALLSKVKDDAFPLGEMYCGKKAGSITSILIARMSGVVWTPRSCKSTATSNFERDVLPPVAVWRRGCAEMREIDRWRDEIDR